MSKIATKFFYIGKYNFKDFPFNSVEELEDHLGPEPIFFGQKTWVVLKDRDNPHKKKNYVWGTYSDDLKVRRARKKTYIWRE